MPTTVRRRRVGRIELRLTLAVVVMAVLPLFIGVFLATRLARQASQIFYDPRVGDELEASLGIYRPMVRALKMDMKHRADAIAASEPLRAAAALLDDKEVAAELASAFEQYSDRVDPALGDAPLVELVALEVFADLPYETCLDRFATGPPSLARPAVSAAAMGTTMRDAGRRPPAIRAREGDASKDFRLLGRVDRGALVDPKRDYVLAQCKPLGPDDTKPAMLVATFATDRARIEHQQDAAEFLEVYRQLERRRDEWVRLNVGFFAAFLGVTILVAATFGFVFARNVSRRVSRVADAARRVASGDLEVRVPELGADEVGALAVTFNHMLRDLAHSRARIEYLQRIGEWQEMARRLAHEIKNPLTPIQLAVEECHSKYAGDDPRMRRLLDTTLEIVTEEVGTLRRLVSEFSDFARLPQARLVTEDLETFLKEIAPPLERLGLGTEPTDAMLTPSGGQAIPVRVKVESAPMGTSAGVAPGRVPVAVDRQMLRKAVDNLVRNAVQAIRAAGQGFRVVVQARRLPDGRIAIDVDDDGPGVPAEDRARIFDPYFTTRTAGTGLGLAIVKKIVIEHGGSIGCEVAEMGGARFRIVLPAVDSAEVRAAVEDMPAA